MALCVNDLSEVLTELFPARTKWYNIGLKLAVPVETLESIKSKNREEPGDCLREMLLRALRSSTPELTWKRIIEVLSSAVVGQEQLAKSLEEKYAQKGEASDTIKPLSDKLTLGLSVIKQWKDTPEKTVAQDAAITDYISRSIESGFSLDVINEQLKKCHLEELLISKEAFTKALQLAAKEYTKKSSENPDAIHINPSISPASAIVKPLFCKDTIHHASVCCHAVSKCNAGDYQKFFKTKELVPGHAFKFVSFSRSKEETFLIAQKKGESTYYFAFKGRPNLSDWPKGFKCFSEGVMAQCGKFPIRYIIELLNKQRRIVLTGFSFGGLLASAVAASVWDTPYISSDLLKENMTCITFGQPLVTVDIVHRVAIKRPEMVTTINAIFTKQDQIPSLMGLLDECWSAKAQQTQTKSTPGVQVSVAAVNCGQTMPFEDQATCDLLHRFVKLQNLPESQELTEDIKAKCHEVMLSCDGGAPRQFTPTFTQHVISVTGLTLISESRNVTALQVQNLTSGIYNEHSMFEYRRDIFNSHLDKHPKYSFPETAQHALDDVQDLKPAVSMIQIHHHGNETAIVIEGSNLWFCYGVTFRKQKLSIPASNVSGSSIQFNRVFVPSDSEVLTNKEEGICLDNHFKSKSIKQEVEVFEKKYSTTTRQAQLAKLTPSQVIELGYLSALLERCGTDSDGLHSHKFDVIKQFLEDVVKVVPFESIAYAIANGNYQTAMQCSKALKTANTKIPKTVLLYCGLLEATRHLQFGVPTHLLHSLEFKAYEEVTQHNTMHAFSHIYMDSGKLVYEGSGCLPGTPFTFHQPVRVQTNVKESDIRPANKEVADELDQLSRTLFSDTSDSVMLPVVSNTAIEELYPIHSDGSSNLKSPLNILVSGRKSLAALSLRSHSNQEMLQIVNTIRDSELHICTSLLGGFMYQSVINIQLSSNKSSQAMAINLYASASVGVWALFSLDYSHVKPILTQCQDKQLLVKLYDYVKGISGISHEPDESDFNPYAAKLQFIVQGMTKTVTCNTQHVSYSLERQLVELCDERSIHATTPVSEITGKWSVLFREKTLSLVHHRYRLLIAQWLKWALMIHNLREELAKYTAVGVVGLVNSGKSKLVNTIFGIEIPTGTTESKRTTVPFLYNLDEKVEGLNVVDFPGVDDEDDSIGDLADLLLTVAQIIVFVVDYRKVHTQSAKKWLERLQKEKVPTLVCLTFGDKLYAEHMTTTGEDPHVEDMSKVIKSQTTITREKLRSTGLHQIRFFSFCQDKDSVLNSDSGREKLREVGIGTPLQVGEWLVKVFKEDFKQNELADQLEVAIC